MNDFIERGQNDDEEDNKSEHTGNVSLSEDEVVQFIEKDLDLNTEFNILLDYSIISKIMLFITKNWETSENQLNFTTNLKKNPVVKYIIKLFGRIVNDLKSSWIFFQIEYLLIFNDLLNDKQFCSDLYFINLVNIINEIVNNYFKLMDTNRLLAVESLFRYSGPVERDYILNNYEISYSANIYNYDDEDLDKRVVYDEGENYYNTKNNDKDIEYEGHINFEKEIEKSIKLRKNSDLSIPDLKQWTENEDILLIQNFIEFGKLKEYLDILDKLFQDKSKKDIKKRIKVLKLKKGEKKAMRMVKKLHNKSKPKTSKITDIIIELSEDFKDEYKKKKITVALNLLKEQLESYKIKKGLLNSEAEIDYLLIPTTEEEIDMYTDTNFISFIKNLGLLPPDENLNENNNETNLETKNKKDKSKFWKLNPKSSLTDIGILIEKLENYQRELAENTDINIELEAQKRLFKEQRKMEKKKRKKDKKRKETHSSFESQKEENLSKISKEKDYNGENLFNDELISNKMNEDYNANDIISYKSKNKKSIQSVNSKQDYDLDFLDEDNNFSSKKRLKKGLNNF